MRLATASPETAPAEGDPAAGDEPVSILLVDDQPANLVAMEAVLAAPGLDLVRATSGPEALRHVLRRDFAAVLMDVRMPGMDGLEAAALIRSRPRSRHTPIILVTAHEDADGLCRGYELGAIDYLIKPIAPAVLRGKVTVLVDLFRAAERIRRQSELLRQMERQRYERELAAAHERWEAERLRAEAEAARQVQERFFPASRVPPDGFDLGGRSFPAAATGGDYFDYVPLADGSLAVTIGDVSGHGFGPALLMAATRAYLRALALTRTDIGELLGLLNRALSVDVPEGRFATLFLCRLDPNTRTMRYASAGHPSGYLLDAAGHVRRLLGSTGPPLAVLPDEAYAVSEPVPLREGDLLVLLTDGIPESPCADGSQFGTERALAVVRGHRDEAPTEIVNALYREARCGGDQADDMTAVVIRVGATPVAASARDLDEALSDTVPADAGPASTPSRHW